ncbi:MAG: pyridoxamine 5'-phosphate oxidase family protein [Clostridia bacterium]|nr:pyridoxamine 5'-phosphate oxidase family protein [Clostridia bacterium]
MNKDFDNILKERFRKDSLISIATVDSCGTPWVRTVDAIYNNGAFYTITYNSTNKMKHICDNPVVAICGEWFSGHGKAESLGYIRHEENKDLADKLRDAFASWYDNGHTNENDVNTIILKITVTDGIIYKDGTRFEF